MRTDILKKRYGEWALVTGASTGIGRAFAIHLSASGINTILIANEEAPLKEVALNITKTSDTRSIPLYGDLSSSAFLNKVVKKASRYEPGIIINNAGYGIMGYFIQHSFSDYIKMLKVDEEAVLFLTHHFCKRFYQQKRRGAIINVSSANADFLRGAPFSAVYSASKSFVKNMSEAIHFEMKPSGIDILTVSPGPTRTSFQKRANTRTLSIVESPENVVRQSFKALGRKSSIITNGYTRVMMGLYHLLPFPEKVKSAYRAWIFRNVLGRKELIRLDE